MPFPIKRHGGQEAAARVLEQQMARGPAGAGDRAARCFERQQKLMPQEGLHRSRDGIPTRRVGLGDALQEARARNSHAWAASGSARGLVSTRSRYLSASRAAMQPVPAEVTAWRYTWSATSPAAKTPGMLVDVASPSRPPLTTM